MKCLIIIALFIACALASGSPLSFKEASRGLAEGGVTVLRQVCKPKLPFLSSIADAVASGIGAALGTKAVDLAAEALAHAASTEKRKEIAGGHAANDECVRIDGLQSGTVEGLSALREASNCAVVLERAVSEDGERTEFGFATGHRVEIMKNDCLSRFIKEHYTLQNGKYLNSDGDSFTEKDSTWEAVFY